MVDLSLQVSNWREFQHYRNRRPPWIKLHRTLLDNYDFHCLPIASRAIAPCLWLIASDDENGVIECASESLAFRLRISEEDLLVALKPLVQRGFFIDASNALADCSQLAMPEREGEGEESPFQGRVLVISKSRGGL
jgi:hypothetical protein